LSILAAIEGRLAEAFACDALSTDLGRERHLGNRLHLPALRSTRACDWRCSPRGRIFRQSRKAHHLL